MKNYMKIFFLILLIPSLSFALAFNDNKVINQRVLCVSHSKSWCQKHQCKVPPKIWCAKKYPSIAP